jgi:hypothetical protein
MKRVKLGGRELRIEDEAVAEFLQKGYSVIDDKGNVIQKGDVTTYNQAVEENKVLRKENEALKAENAQLKADLEVYKKQVFNMLKPVEEASAEPDAPVEEKPKAEKKSK